MTNICGFCNKEFATIYTLKKHNDICKVKKQDEKVINDKELMCEFCSKIFSNKYNLNNHKNTTKKCIDIQKSLNNKEVKYPTFSCEFCKKNFTLKNSLICHNLSCIDKYKFELKEKEIELKDKDNLLIKINTENENYKEICKKLEHQVEELQNKLDKIANKAIDKPTTTNNTINNKIELHTFPSQIEIDKKIESQFNDKYLWDGIKGVAQFVYDHIIKLEDGSLAYACFDTSRQMFKYKDKDGNDIKDPKASKLRKMIKPGLLRQSQSLLDYFNEECDYLEKRKNKGLEIDRKEYNTMNTLREKALEVGCEILSIEETNKFSNELATISCI